jgi:hypothetical protein
MIITLRFNKAVEIATECLKNSADPIILNLRAEAFLQLNNITSAI